MAKFFFGRKYFPYRVGLVSLLVFALLLGLIPQPLLKDYGKAAASTLNSSTNLPASQSLSDTSTVEQTTTAQPATGQGTTNGSTANQASNNLQPEGGKDQGKEVLEARTANSKTFDLGNGKHAAKIYLAPIHYKDDNGVFQEIDNTLVETTDGQGYTNRANSFKVYFAKDLGKRQAISAGKSGKSIAFSPEGAKAKAVKTAGSGLTYEEVYPGIDLKYELGSEFLKEFIVLKKAPKETSFTFDLSLTGVSAVKKEDGSIDLVDDSTGLVDYTINAPFMYDSNHAPGSGEPTRSSAVSYDVKKGVDGSLNLTVNVDPNWINAPERVYPIYIDPAVSRELSANQDAFTCDAIHAAPYDYTSVNFGADCSPGFYQLRLGYISSWYGNSLSYIKFDLSQFANVSIDSASLNFYCKEAYSNPTYYLNRVTSDWSESGVNYSNRPSTADSVGVGNAYAGSWTSTDVTTAMKNWASGAWTNYGLMISVNSNDPNSFKRFVAREDTSGLAPYLYITYETPSISITSPPNSSEIKSYVYNKDYGCSFPAIANNTPQLLYSESDFGNTITSRTVSVDGSAVNVGNGGTLSKLSDGFHTVQVKVIDALGDTVLALNSFYVDANPPTTPQALRAAINTGSATLSWVASTDAASPYVGYNIYRSTSTGAYDYTKPLNSQPITDTTYTDTTASYGNIYYYQVKAVDAGGHLSSASNEANIRFSPPTASAAPAGGSYNSAQSVTLSPIDPTSASIYYTTDGTNPTTSSTQYIGLPINILGTTTLKYIAVDAAGNQSQIYTENYTMHTTPPSAPGSPSATTASTSQINLTWAASTVNTPFYRLYSNGQFFFTASSYERDVCVSNGWNYDYPACYVLGSQTANTVPLYRLCGSSEHFFTTSAYERDVCISNGWTYEGIACYVSSYQTADTIPLYRLCGSTHLFTTSAAERDNCINNGWRYEGVACYVWGGAVSTAGYKIDRSTDGVNWNLAGTTSTNSYSDTSLSPATQYYYRVSAYDAATNYSAYSTCVSATTNALSTYSAAYGPDNTPTPMTTNSSYTVSMSIKNTGSNTWPTGGSNPVNLSYHWVDSAGNSVDGLRTNIATDMPTGASNTISATVIAPSTPGTYTLKWDLVQGVTWFSGQGVPTRNVTVTVTDATPPTAPGSLSASAISPTQVNLLWGASTDNASVAGYKIERSPDALNWVQVGTSSTNSYSDSTVSTNTRYNYRVRAYDQAGNNSAYSSVAYVATPVRYEETSSGITYTGAPWNTWSDPRLSGGSEKNTNVFGNTATFTFTGTSITWPTTKYIDRGIVKVYIDGLYQQDVDLYSSTFLFKQNVFTKTGLTQDTHTLQLVLVGKNPSAVDSYMAIDAFDVTTIDTTPPTIAASIVGSTYNSAQSITLTASEPASIYYTTDGTNPTTSSTRYVGLPINIFGTTTLKYMAIDVSGNQSQVYSQSYIIDATPPTVSFVQPSSDTTLTAGTTINISGSDNVSLSQADLTLQKYGISTIQDLGIKTTNLIPQSDLNNLQAYQSPLGYFNPAVPQPDGFWRVQRYSSGGVACTEVLMSKLYIVTGGQTYTESFLFRNDGTSCNFVINVLTGNGDHAVTPTIVDLGGGIKRATATYTAQATDTYIRAVDIWQLTGDFTYIDVKRGELYSSPNNKFTETDRRGNATTYQYDNNFNTTSVTDALGNTTSYTYDSDFNTLTKTDALGRVTTCTYDPITGNTLTAADPKGNTTTYTYYPNTNNVHTKADPLGTTTYTYDANNNKTSEADDKTNTTSYVYDKYGELICQTDAQKHKTTYTYDGTGDKTSDTDPSGNKTIYAYDQIGDKVGETDPKGDTTTYTYDLLGHILTAITPGGSTTTYTYDANGNRASVTDANSKTTTWTYNALDKVLTEKTPDNKTKTYTYDPNENLASVTDAAVKTTTYGYDALDRQSSISYPDNTTVSYTYDAVGNKTKMVDSSGTTNYAYDQNNNLTQETGPAGVAVSYSYNSIDKLMAEAIGSSSVYYNYDSLGNLTSLLNNLNANPTLTVDADLNGVADGWVAYNEGTIGATRSIDGGQKITVSSSTGGAAAYILQDCAASAGDTFNFSAMAKISTNNNFSGCLRLDFKNSSGVVIGSYNASLAQVSSNYTLLNVSNKVAPTGTARITMCLNASVSNGAVGSAWFKDCVLQKTNGTAIASFGYDANNNRTSTTYENAATMNSTYDNNKLSSSTNSGPTDLISQSDLNNLHGWVSGVGNNNYAVGQADGFWRVQRYYNGTANTEVLMDKTYGVVGGQTYTESFLFRNDGTGCNFDISFFTNGGHHTVTPVVQDLGGGIKRATATYTTQATDTYIRAIDIILTSGDFTYIDIKGAELYNALSQFASYNYTYDSDDLIATEKDIAGSKTTYTYDGQNRLSDAKDSTKDTAYTFDAVGNRATAKTTVGSVISTTAYTYDSPTNELTQVTKPDGSTIIYTYDANGSELTRKLSTDTNPTTYTYNGNYQLTNVTKPNGDTIGFTYDGDNRRLSKTVNNATTKYVYARGLLTQEIAPDGTTSTYTYDDKGAPVKLIKAGATYYFHYNGKGDVVALTDSVGAVAATYKYDDWGNIVSSTGSINISFGYRGQFGYVYDKETGLYFLKSRYYDPETGRFTSKDRFRGFEDRPASQNQYTYCEGDPVNKVDADGQVAYALAGGGVIVTLEGLQALDWIPIVGEIVIGGTVIVVGGYLIWHGPDSPGVYQGTGGYPGELINCHRSWRITRASDSEEGKELVRKGQELLGRAHNPARAQEWREWYSKLSPQQKKNYRKNRGPKPRKGN